MDKRRRMVITVIVMVAAYGWYLGVGALVEWLAHGYVRLW